MWVGATFWANTHLRHKAKDHTLDHKSNGEKMKELNGYLVAATAQGVEVQLFVSGDGSVYSGGRLLVQRGYMDTSVLILHLQFWRILRGVSKERLPITVRTITSIAV
jgi:hypothetical protein